MNGSLTKHENKNISSVTCNLLNRPEQISITGKGTITYLYACPPWRNAAGNKLAKTVTETGQPQKTTQYIGGMIFENNVLQHVATEEGRARIESGVWKFDYFLKDHLGNVRMMLADNGTVLEETHYYPFGLVQKGISIRQTGNLYNKEKTFQNQQIDEDLDLNWVQFKYRNHDPQIGRFIEIDPLSDKYAYNSTYAFSENKVTTHIELEGLETAVLPTPAGPMPFPIFNPGSVHDNSVNLFPDLDRNLEVFSETIAYTVMEEVFVKPPEHMGFFERIIYGAIGFVDRVFSNSDDKGATSSSASEAKEKGDYSHLKEPKNVGDGKKTTPAQRKRILEENKKQNDGELRSDGDGRRLNPPKANKKGEKADMNQAEVDHNIPRSKRGSNSNSNQRVISKEENLKKGNRTE